MVQGALNLRFLLWREKSDRDVWVSYLSERVGIEHRRAKELIHGGEPDSDEIERICEAFDISRATLVSVNMIEEMDVDLQRENIRRLISSLGYGGTKRLARDLGLGEATVYRWKRGEQHPNRRNLKELGTYFGLSDNAKLRTEPLFLAPGALGRAEQKDLIRKRIDCLDADDLRELYPALVRMLGDG